MLIIPAGLESRSRVQSGRNEPRIAERGPQQLPPVLRQLLASERAPQYHVLRYHRSIQNGIQYLNSGFQILRPLLRPQSAVNDRVAFIHVEPNRFAVIQVQCLCPLSVHLTPPQVRMVNAPKPSKDRLYGHLRGSSVSAGFSTLTFTLRGELAAPVPAHRAGRRPRVLRLIKSPEGLGNTLIH